MERLKMNDIPDSEQRSVSSGGDGRFGGDGSGQTTSQLVGQPGRSDKELAHTWGGRIVGSLPDIGKSGFKDLSKRAVRTAVAAGLIGGFVGAVLERPRPAQASKGEGAPRTVLAEDSAASVLGQDDPMYLLTHPVNPTSEEGLLYRYAAQTEGMRYTGARVVQFTGADGEDDGFALVGMRSVDGQRIVFVDRGGKIVQLRTFLVREPSGSSSLVYGESVDQPAYEVYFNAEGNVVAVTIYGDRGWVEVETVGGGDGGEATFASMSADVLTGKDVGGVEVTKGLYPRKANDKPPEVAQGVEFAIERKTIEAPDGSSLEVVGWGTEDGLMIYFQKEFADKAYTFGWGDSMKEAGAILMPSPNVSRVELKRRFRRLHDGVVLAKLGKIDTSKPIPLADLEEGEKYLAMHPGDTYEVSYGSKVGKVRADLPIEVVFVEPKYSAINSMDADFGDKEAKGMAPFTSGERLVLLDSGRGQDRVNEKGRMVVFFEAWSGAKPDILMSSAGHWQLRILTVLGCEAGGAFDFKGFRGQESDVDTAAAFRGTVPPNSSFWRPGGDLYLEDGRPPKNPVLGWSRPAD